MNDIEFEQLMDAMSTVWPQKELTPEEARRWWANTRLMPFDEGMEIVKVLERTRDFWPTWAQFHSCWYGVRVGMGKVTVAVEQGDPDYQGPTDQGRAALSQIWEMYDAAKAKLQHDHHGPSPCPVCGGIRPEPLGRARRVRPTIVGSSSPSSEPRSSSRKNSRAPRRQAQPNPQ